MVLALPDTSLTPALLQNSSRHNSFPKYANKKNVHRLAVEDDARDEQRTHFPAPHFFARARVGSKVGREVRASSGVFAHARESVPRVFFFAQVETPKWDSVIELWDSEMCETVEVIVVVRAGGVARAASARIENENLLVSRVFFHSV